MKSVLSITTLLLAAILLTPAMGYTIQVQKPDNYSISAGTPANYSIATGEPAHMMNYTVAAAPYSVPPSVSVKKSPYTFTALEPVPYYMKTSEPQGTRALGPQTSPSVAKLGSMAKIQPSAQATPLGQVNAAAAVAVAPAVAPIEAPVAEAPTAAEPTFSLSGKVYDDAEGNGAMEAGEAGLVGWTISLAGAAEKSATTSADGSYTFADLAPGNYTVAEVVPTGWNVISPENGEYSVEITSADVTGMDFANQKVNVTANVTAPALNATVA